MTADVSNLGYYTTRNYVMYKGHQYKYKRLRRPGEGAFKEYIQDCGGKTSWKLSNFENPDVAGKITLRLIF
jgi:hypothetical protein